MTFKDLQLSEQILEAISYMGFENATPIQEKAIPTILKNNDLLACAQTGTGKTAAFVLPILNKLIDKNTSETNTLIVVPTRELAIQIDEQIQGFSYFVSASSIAVYGGGDGKEWDKQKGALKNGVDIIVATPGRLISLLKLGFVNSKTIQHLILDEADRMLDMGFLEDIQAIISYLPKKHQTLMFSATMPIGIKQLARKILFKPSEISLSVSKPAEGVDQKVFLIYDDQKDKLLSHIISERKDYNSIIIFSSTKAKVSEIVKTLKNSGFNAKGISSNLEQKEREDVLNGFRSKRIRILVATDVMSRGIDIKEINMVVNYDVPGDAEDYVHRVGRTARVDAKGEAITFVSTKDMQKFHRIEQLIQIEIPKLSPPEKFGKAPTWEVKRKKSNKKRQFYKKKKNYNRKKR